MSWLSKLMHIMVLITPSYQANELRKTNFSHKGIAWEGLEKFDMALETYAKASDYIRTSQPPTHYYSVQYWTSKVMYRLCMLSLRLEAPAYTLAHFRRYKLLVDTAFKGNMGVRERLAIYYWYWRTLSDIVKERIDMEKKEATEYFPFPVSSLCRGLRS